jgi:serine/threonine protein kinase
MCKEHFDLRNLIECSMSSKSGKDCGPFSKEEAEVMMYSVALGVDWLHGHGIVHRDLKASNVLVKEFKSGWPRWSSYVADWRYCKHAKSGRLSKDQRCFQHQQTFIVMG